VVAKRPTALDLANDVRSWEREREREKEKEGEASGKGGEARNQESAE
jgi:hypothetical protein